VKDMNITNEPLFIRPVQAAKILGISKNTMYWLMHNGVIPYKKLGSVILIPRSFIEDFISDTNQEIIAK
jgi:excisionase family DNA binding protein